MELIWLNEDDGIFEQVFAIINGLAGFPGVQEKYDS